MRGTVRWGGVAVVTALALTGAACGSSGPSRSARTTPPTRATSTVAPSTTPTTSSTTSTAGPPMVTASLPVIVCQTTAGVATTTTSLPASVSVPVPPADAQQGDLAVYSDETGSLMLIGPTSGWTCSGTFGADGSGMMALAPVGTSVPSGSGTTWHVPQTSTVQAIVAQESGASPVQGAALACPFFSAAKAANQQALGKGCATASPPQEQVTTNSAVEVSFTDPAGVAGQGFPSGGANAARGVLLYQPKPNEASAYQATCTLPPGQRDLCTAVLNHFVANFG